MRTNGRKLRYSTLAERRLFMANGITSLRVPRGMNPYAVARRLERLAKNSNSPDAGLLQHLVQQAKVRVPSTPGPELDVPEPVHAPMPDACCAA